MTNWESGIVDRRSKLKGSEPTPIGLTGRLRLHVHAVAGFLVLGIVALIGVASSLYNTHQEFQAGQAELALEPFERVTVELLISDDRSTTGKDIVVKETIEPRIASGTIRRGVFVDVPMKLHGSEAVIQPEPIEATLNGISIPILPPEQINETTRFKVGLPDFPLQPGRNKLGLQYRARGLPLIKQSGVEELTWRLTRPAQVLTESVSGAVTLPSYLAHTSTGELPSAVAISFWVQRDGSETLDKDAVRFQSQYHLLPGSDRGNWLLSFESTRPLDAFESVWVAIAIGPEGLRLN